ncbi:thiol-disulfide oxidoreductase DCC family protein [Heyndrickxia acidicola]|uniref:Thiol-disulfide oxidoreductase DCC family protein n=1 Tax=Heyndrickxia acidicola TaxID=209389 RepID=A0ABU6MJ37_9BACI|nr:thiol-disulfide oxidoreductase DCC family protein [Heyndrickxia acidicola]MED1204021.1 thiol-disulfide oxidoreductase DCC family protein [Heyndrickxia acidicola]
MSGIVLFDGECNLCSSSVQFIIKRDVEGYFRFASLQGKNGGKLLKEYGVKEDMQSVVLIEEGKAYTQSLAALRICRHLKGYWKLLWFLRVIPSPIRNFFYRLVAKNRYKWFGKSESCMLPQPHLREKFLD